MNTFKKFLLSLAIVCVGSHTAYGMFDLTSLGSNRSSRSEQRQARKVILEIVKKDMSAYDGVDAVIQDIQTILTLNSDCITDTLQDAVTSFACKFVDFYEDILSVVSERESVLAQAISEKVSVQLDQNNTLLEHFRGLAGEIQELKSENTQLDFELKQLKITFQKMIPALEGKFEDILDEVEEGNIERTARRDQFNTIMHNTTTQINGLLADV